MALGKKFVKVQVPIINEEIELLGAPEFLDKKTILLDMSRKMRGKGMEIKFQIRNTDGELTAYPKKIQLMSYYLRRMMRKRTNYVEDSLKINCKDIQCIIKPFLITRKKVSRAVRQNLRKTVKEFLIDFSKERTYLELCDALLSGMLQKDMLPKLKKIYPLSFYDVRVLETKELEKAELELQEKITIEEDSSNEIKEETTEEVSKEETKKSTKKAAKKTVKKTAKKSVKKEDEE
jgi:ribosomal protein S3AE